MGARFERSHRTNPCCETRWGIAHLEGYVSGRTVPPVESTLASIAAKYPAGFILFYFSRFYFILFFKVSLYDIVILYI